MTAPHATNDDTGKRRPLGFFAFLIIAISLYGLIHRSLLRSLHTIIPSPHLKVVLGTLWIISIASLFIARVTRNWFTLLLYRVGVTWMGVSFIIFLTLFPISLIALAFNYELQPWMLIPLICLLAIAAYQARSTRVKTIKIPLVGLKKPIRLVQLTDLHIGEVYGPRFLENVVEKTNKLNPDLIVITGDVFDGGGKLYKGIVDPLAKLKAKYGSYFVRGNHEVYEGIAQTNKLVAQTGVHVLDNQVVAVAGLEIVGVSYPEDMRDDLRSTIKRLERKTKLPRVLLRHEPRDPLYASQSFQLMLSGHTHNGQLWPLSYLVSLAYPFRVGLHKINKMFLYIGPGIGTWGPPFRIGSSSEITLFELYPAKHL